jgi:DNA-binding NarL/FixJ family response regulator
MIVENDPVLLQTLCVALDKRESINIIAAVSSRETAMLHVTDSPDIVLLNPDALNELALSRFMRSLQTKSPGTRVIHLLKDTLPDDNLIARIRTGVRGYLKTADPPATVIKAIHAVFGGEIWAERRILEKAVSVPLLSTATPVLASLTNREREMLTQVIRGASNREIALSSSISERTVKTHLYRVYRKLNVKSRTKAIALFAHS